jgi:phosphonopyruvate decarboxylase
MVPASSFIDAARNRGFRLFTGVPCSYLKPLINAVIDDESLAYVAAANEGDAVAIAAGAELGGTRAVAIFQNSGLGNAVNPLTSLVYTSRLPVLLVVTLRGEPGGTPDEPQHELMGRITTRLLEEMAIPWAYFPTDEDDLAPVMDRAEASIGHERQPFALVMRKGSVAPQPLRSASQGRQPEQRAGAPGQATHYREALLRAVQSNERPGDVIVATTGFTGRELYACEDRPNQFYLVGAMGCAASLGLGLALSRPDRRVIVLDGDGALLMRLGALATAGHYRPPNMIHVLLDNGMHESTGGQATVSGTVDFCAVAAACGYPVVSQADDPDALGAVVADPSPGLRFVRSAVLPGVPDDLPRPAIAPERVTARLRRFLGAGHDHAPASA